MRALCDSACSGEQVQAEYIDGQLSALHQALFTESNPIPVKWAVQQLGFTGAGIRLPLTVLSKEHHDTVRAAMAAAGVEIVTQ